MRTTMRETATRTRAAVGVAMLAAVLLTGCNGLIDQQATYTSSSTQTITGTAPTRKGDPLTGVTVNGIAGALDGQHYSAVVPLDGVAVFNRVLVVASYQSGFTSTERSTVAYADGTHATVVAPTAPVAGGAGVRLTAAGWSKLLADAATPLYQSLPIANLSYPTSSINCGIGTCIVTQGAGGFTIGDPGNRLSMALTNPSAMTILTTLPNLRVYLNVNYPGGSCSLVVTYSKIEVYDNLQIAADPTEAGGVTVRQGAGSGQTLLFSKSTSGCSMVGSGILTPILNSIDPVMTNEVPSLLSAPTVVNGVPDFSRTNLSLVIEGLLPQLAPASGPLFDGVTGTSSLSSAVTDGNGAFLGADADSVASTVATGAPSQADSLGFGAPAAAAPGSTGAFGLGFDLGVGASFTSLNQALAAATERGALNTTVTVDNGTPLTYNGLNSLVGLGGPLATDRPVQLVVTPELAPAVTTDSHQTEGGFARIHVGGLRVTAQFADTKSTFLSFVVDFDTDAYLTVNSGKAMLSVTNPEAASTNVDELLRLAPIPAGAGRAVFTQLQGDLLGPLVNGGIPVFTLPVLAGHTLTEVSSGRVGDSAYLFLTIA